MNILFRFVCREFLSSLTPIENISCQPAIPPINRSYCFFVFNWFEEAKMIILCTIQTLTGSGLTKIVHFLTANIPGYFYGSYATEGPFISYQNHFLNEKSITVFLSPVKYAAGNSANAAYHQSQLSAGIPVFA
jgi:hypothetical protein